MAFADSIGSATSRRVGRIPIIDQCLATWDKADAAALRAALADRSIPARAVAEAMIAEGVECDNQGGFVHTWRTRNQA